MKSYIYTFIRRDISPEQRIIQVGHACHEAGKEAGPDARISSLILLEAENEPHLKHIAYSLDDHGIDYHAFFEPDNEMGYSAICTRPITDTDERGIFRKWDLFRHTD